MQRHTPTVKDLQNDISLLKTRITSLECAQADDKKVIALLVTAGFVDQETVELARTLATSTRL